MARKKETSKEVVKVEPTRLPSPFEEMERWFDEFFRRPFSLFGPSWLPRLRMPEIEEISPSVDIFEEGDDVVVKAELPGMKKDDIDVTLSDDTITISGEKKREEKVEKKNYYRYERSFGSFSRSFRLPVDVQADKAKATFKDGILEIRIPKTEEAKKRQRKLQIKEA
ncbi:MAG TPA: Hsp20/alpha crystallin family protein [Nitrospirae bacterium]|nr:Hsp20/alpha crystallin family protein [Nitrospirota bacterium]